MPYKWVSLLGMSFALFGCSVQPTSLTQEEVEARVTEDMQILAVARQPVTGPISLFEAMARALAFNLDLELERYRASLVETELDLSRHDQLPAIVADHAADGRSNYTGGSSQSLLTGRQSLESSTSSDRYTNSDDLGLSWDILDFGVSYFRARQAADRVLLVDEQQRSVVNRILTDVQKAYWRAASHDRLISRLERLMDEVGQQLESSRQIEARGLEAPLASLIYQRELIDNSRELYRLYEGLTGAKIELASLMNLPPGQDFELAISEKAISPPPLPFAPDVMETIALQNRPELREVTYQKRISTNEVKASFLGMLPGISLDYAHTYSSNSFLFNSDWTDYSARISWNLMSLFRYPDVQAMAIAQANTLDAQRLALSAAVLTQVHVGVARYQHSKNEYRIASDLHETQDKILKQIRIEVDAESTSEQMLIREEMNALLAEVRYDIAYANLEGAFADLFAAMGLNPSLDELDTASVAALAISLEAYFEARRSRINGEVR